MLCTSQTIYSKRGRHTLHFSMSDHDVITKKKLAFAMDFPENDEKKH
jgi:hypothetical protein